MNKGFTVAELIVVIAIGAILTTISMTVFVNTIAYHSVDKDVQSVQSSILTARAQAMGSKNFATYGVRFASSSVAIFQGTSFSTASTTMVYNLSSRVSISSVQLSNSSTSVYFNKLTGVPSATGTIQLRLNTSSNTRTITIQGTGIVDVQ